ncbi:MAG: carbohydrate porin, partial [Desulfurobacteriaceae bacterium]
DTLSFGVAAVIPNDKLQNDDVEYHFEGYYRFQISENLAITPDVQFVTNPHGDSDNDNIFAGMVRAEFSF